MSLSWFLTIVAYLGLVFLPGLQSGTLPSATSVASDPESCDVAPRRLDEVIALDRGSASDDRLASLFGGEPVLEPDGRLADAATEAAVTTVGHEAAACFAAGEPLRGLALFTDDLVGRIVALETETGLRASLDLFNYSKLLPSLTWMGDAFQLVGKPEVRMLADGRATMIVTVEETVSPRTSPFRLIFVFRPVNGDWLLDDLAVAALPTAGPSTPDASFSDKGISQTPRRGIVAPPLVR